MPRKGTHLSPEAQARQDASIRKWKKEKLAQITIGVKKERKQAYMDAAERRGVSMRKLLIDYLEQLVAEDEREG